MRAILLFCVLVAALVSFPAPVSTSYVDPPRAKPSPRPHPHGHRNYAPPDYPWPYPKYDDKGNRPPRPKPSSWYVKRADDDHSSEARSLEEQNVVWSDGAKGGLTWGLEDRCPAPLSACPVRGVPDADAYECVDLLSDLDSCGGCAADDIACVFSPCFSSSFHEVAELNRLFTFLFVVTRQNLALTAMPSPMHAASNVSLDFARCARAWKGMWLCQRATCVCASKLVGRIPP